MTAIALFGPSSSGKTTVLRAFCQAMAGHVDDYLADTSMDVSIAIDGQSIDLYEESPSMILPTSHMQIRDLTFRRFPKDKLPNYRQQVSTFQHKILLHDNQGKLFARGADKSINSLEALKAINPEFAQAWRNLENSPGLVILLDHALLKDSTFEGHFEHSPIINSPVERSLVTTTDDFDMDKLLSGSDKNDLPPSIKVRSSDSMTVREDQKESFSENQAIFTKAQYARMIGRIGEWLPRNTADGYERKVAVCFTKVDLLGDAIKLDPVELIQHNFGDTMIRAIQSLRGAFGSESVYVCALSALGYDIRDGESNFDLTRRWLKNETYWKPENVHKPFLWIFEELERDQIIRTSNQLRAFKSTFRDMRLKAHIPYLAKKNNNNLR